MQKICLKVILMMMCASSLNVLGQEIYLDCQPASSSVITSGTVSELDGASAFTMEAMVYPTSNSIWSHILSKVVGSTNRISLQSHEGKLYCIVANGNNSYRYTSSSVLQLNTWQHVAMVYNGSLSDYNKITLYIDGVAKSLSNSSTALPATAPSNTATFKLDNGNFVGDIDEVRVWDVALTSYSINNWMDKQIDNTHPEYANLALYWDLDDYATPTVANGTEGTTYDGVIANATYVFPAPPVANYWLDFIPSSDVVTSGTVSELDGASTFTLEAKVNLDTYTTWTNILRKIVSSTDRIALQSHSGKLYCIVSNGANAYRYTSTPVLQLDTWHHIAMVYNGSLSGYNKVELYVDGIQQTLNNSSNALPSTAPSNTAVFIAGHSILDGQIDEVRVWDVALSGSTIDSWKDSHLDNSHPQYANLALYWDLDDFDTPSVANGSEGTTYNGTINNAVYKGEIDPVVPVDQRVITYLPYYKFSSVTEGIFDHLTHLIYFSLGMNSSGDLGRVSSSGVFTPLSSIPQVQIDLDTLKTWRGTRNTKIFVVFGGWVQSDYFDEMAANATARANFIQNVKDLLTTNGVDGADIDWEGYNGPVNDTNYGLLLSEMKAAFSGTGLGISVAINKTHTSLADEFTANVEHIGLMSYGKVFDDGMQVSLAQLKSYVNNWIAAGVPADKIVAGVPAYGRTPSDNTAITYKYIIDTYNPATSVNSIVDNGKTYYFNGVDAIQTKAQYVKDEGLGGIMMWEQGQDVDITHAKSLLNAITQIIAVDPLKSAKVKTKTLSFENKDLLAKVYPNPFNNSLNISVNLPSDSHISMSLFDIQGREYKRVFEGKELSGTHTFHIKTESIPNGIYFLRVVSNNTVQTQKIIKR